MKNSAGVLVWVIVLVAAQLFVNTGDSAMAQRGRRGGMRGMMLTNKFVIVQNEKVQKDLGLEEEVTEKLAEMGEKAGEEMRNAWEENQGDFEAIGKSMEEINDKMVGKLKEILNEKQQKRLDQIYLQVNGPSVLTTKEVAAMLELTEEQTGKLDDVLQSNQEELREMFSSFREMEREEIQEKMETWQKERDEKLLAVLNEEQTEAFKKAQGEKIDVDADDFRRRRGGRGRGGDDRGRRGDRRGGDRDGNNQDF